jgi:hypothetical protein
VVSSDGQLILPLHLAKFQGKGGEEFRAFNHERNQWFRDHGINPGDWRAVFPILEASQEAHGIPSIRRRLVVPGDESA